MSQRVVCPECDAAVRVADDQPAGKRVRCPECQTVFSPGKAAGARTTGRGRRDEDSDDRPRRKTKSRGVPVGLIIGLAAGGLLLLAVVVVVLVVAMGRGNPQNAGPINGAPAIPNLIPQIPIGRAYTIAEMQQLKSGMTVADVEKMLGPGRAINVAEARAAYHEVNPGVNPQAWGFVAQGNTDWMAWGNKAGGIYAGFAKSKKGEIRLGMAFYTLKQGLHSEFMQGDFAGIESVDRKDADNAKIAAFDKDPKWATGPKVRELVVGKWKRDFSELELKPGGGIRSVFPVLQFDMRDPTAYRFRDDVTMEIDTPDVFKREITRTNAFRVYVNADELHLRKINAMPNLPVLWDGPYRRME